MAFRLGLGKYGLRGRPAQTFGALLLVGVGLGQYLGIPTAALRNGVVHVAPWGSDFLIGHAKEWPLRSLARAVVLAESGETILLWPGYYHETVLIRPTAGRRGVLRQVGLIALVCALSLALCLLAGGLAALLEKLELTRVFTSIPNRARQASAEVMLAMAERSGLPLAGFMIFLSLRPMKSNLEMQAIAASVPPADHPSFPD